MVNFLEKRVFLDKKKNKWCIVKLFRYKKDMQLAYKNCGHPKVTYSYKTLGAHHAYIKFKVPKRGKPIISKETGTIFLSVKNCGAGIVSHEFMHAVLWAWKFNGDKKQYPITINNMQEEEELLHNLTYAVRQFYEWYWKVEKKLK